MNTRAKTIWELLLLCGLLAGTALTVAAPAPEVKSVPLVPGGFGGRTAEGKKTLLEREGGTKESEAAVARGLQFLARHQANDGSWPMDRYHFHAQDDKGNRFMCNCAGGGMKNDVAGTAFGLLPFLGAGFTHKDKAQKEYAGVVDRGLKFLLRKQDKKNGQFGGMYEHGLATIVLCEAYGMTADPALKAAAQKAIDYIVAAQHEKGGWRYGPKQAGDTSVTGWELTALKSGQIANLKVPKAALNGASKFLDSLMDPNNFGYGYTSAGSSPTLTAVGLLCRENLGWSKRKKEFVGGLDYMKKTPPSVDNMYYTYYATQVLHHVGGDDWKKWNEKTRNALVKSQDKGDDPKHPHQRGSWNPAKDQHGGAWGRIGQTSLSLLTLEVYYRHLPLYRRDGGNKDK
jgi:hypothetical protein